MTVHGLHEIFASTKFAALLEELQQRPCEDYVGSWPAQQLAAMADCGIMRWDIPDAFDGMDLGEADLLEGLRLLSSACLTSTFVLTQRSAAVRRIVTSTNSAARQRLLPRLRDGKIFATVGISHLTTSGQHLNKPLVEARETDDGFRLSGLVPWATGATHADYLITGGAMKDGRQILAAVPTDRWGVEVQPPVHLMALNATQTGAVKLSNVSVARDEILHGPVEAVMKQSTGGGAGSLGTSALAIGATTGILHGFLAETEKRPELERFLEPLRLEHDRLVSDLRLAVTGQHSDGDLAAESIRRRSNSLVMRSAQAWLAATKGAGFVATHPAARAVAESMFFLVWSCPQPVLNANLQELACAPTP